LIIEGAEPPAALAQNYQAGLKKDSEQHEPDDEREPR